MKKKSPKQVKSFTVDSEAYDYLVERLKESPECGISVSSFLNDHLLCIYQLLKGILDYYEEKNIPISRAWVIREFFEDRKPLPLTAEDMEDPGIMWDWHEIVQENAGFMLQTYEVQRVAKKKKRESKEVILYGVCHQCKHWGSEGFCSIRNRTTRSFERCFEFAIKKGIKKKDLEKVRVSGGGRVKSTDHSITID